MRPTLGSVVMLLTGGPEMTVDRVVDTVHVECVWFDTSGRIYRETFDYRSLEVLPKLAKSAAA